MMNIKYKTKILSQIQFYETITVVVLMCGSDMLAMANR
jgi:hypothetical protein